MSQFITPTFTAMVATLSALSASPTSAQTTSDLPSATVPGTGNYVVVGPRPDSGNPGNQVTISPDRFQTSSDSRSQPTTSYGATVTIPLGTLSPKK